MKLEVPRLSEGQEFTGQRLPREFGQENSLGSDCPVNLRGKIRWAVAAQRIGGSATGTLPGSPGSLPGRPAKPPTGAQA